MWRDETHVIQEDADAFFDNARPRRWVRRDQHPDYHIDFKVDVYDGPDRSGLAFDAQVKGTKRLRVAKDHAAFRVETRHLVEYADPVREPVFLAVVDVTRRVGYWLFTQRYVDEVVRADEGWRGKQKGVSRPGRWHTRACPTASHGRG